MRIWQPFIPGARPKRWIYKMTDKIEKVDGMLGNFERRRQIERETAESRPVGRDHPRQREMSPGSPTWNEIHTEERLVDEKG